MAWRIYDLFQPSKPNTTTVCPNCEKERARVPTGRYKCTSCGASFDVDYQGDTDIPSLTSIRLSIIVGFLLSLLLPSNFFFKYEEFVLIRVIIFGCLGVFLFSFGIRDLIRHKARFNS